MPKNSDIVNICSTFIYVKFSPVKTATSCGAVSENVVNKDCSLIISIQYNQSSHGIVNLILLLESINSL